MHQRISPQRLATTTTGLGTALVAALRWDALRIAVVGGLTLFWLAGASTASAAPACCTVTSIAKSGEITAKETKGARTFQFQVADPALRSKLRVGAPVYANFDTKQVSLDGKKPCCKILNISTAAKQPVPGTTQPAPGTTQVGSQTQAINPEIIALQTTSDLVAKDLGFTALGEITFKLVNRGEVGINVPAKATGQSLAQQGAASGPPIKIDIYIGSSLIKSVFQSSIGGKQTKNFKENVPSTLPKPKCLETRNLKVVIDPQNQIKELHDDNNVTEATNSARPCPDLAIKSIKRHYTGLFNETYRVKVTIINQGNAPSPSNEVWGTSLPGGVWPVTGWPTLVPTHTMPALAPGETTSFKTGGSVLSGIHTSVRVMLDYHSQIEESDESNNRKDERL